ncbi:hypothetical protein HDU85_003673 [Gaertneriomyces sp. JEL0708]|nr:hypothetical protein HDU85_003673 [Gaertneriomyces sp. JEL0708]
MDDEDNILADILADEDDELDFEASSAEPSRAASVEGSQKKATSSQSLAAEPVGVQSKHGKSSPNRSSERDEHAAREPDNRTANLTDTTSNRAASKGDHVPSKETVGRPLVESREPRERFNGRSSDPSRSPGRPTGSKAPVDRADNGSRNVSMDDGTPGTPRGVRAGAQVDSKPPVVDHRSPHKRSSDLGERFNRDSPRSRSPLKVGRSSSDARSQPVGRDQEIRRRESYDQNNRRRELDAPSGPYDRYGPRYDDSVGRRDGGRPLPSGATGHRDRPVRDERLADFGHRGEQAARGRPDASASARRMDHSKDNIMDQGSRGGRSDISNKTSSRSDPPPPLSRGSSILKGSDRRLEVGRPTSTPGTNQTLSPRENRLQDRSVPPQSANKDSLPPQRNQPRTREADLGRKPATPHHTGRSPGPVTEVREAASRNNNPGGAVKRKREAEEHEMEEKKILKVDDKRMSPIRPADPPVGGGIRYFYLTARNYFMVEDSQKDGVWIASPDTSRTLNTAYEAREDGEVLLFVSARSSKRFQGYAYMRSLSGQTPRSLRRNIIGDDSYDKPFEVEWIKVGDMHYGKSSHLRIGDIRHWVDGQELSSEIGVKLQELLDKECLDPPKDDHKSAYPPPPATNLPAEATSGKPASELPANGRNQSPQKMLSDTARSEAPIIKAVPDKTNPAPVTLPQPKVHPSRLALLADESVTVTPAAKPRNPPVGRPASRDILPNTGRQELARDNRPSRLANDHRNQRSPADIRSDRDVPGRRTDTFQQGPRADRPTTNANSISREPEAERRGEPIRVGNDFGPPSRDSARFGDSSRAGTRSAFEGERYRSGAETWGPRGGERDAPPRRENSSRDAQTRLTASWKSDPRPAFNGKRVPEETGKPTIRAGPERDDPFKRPRLDRDEHDQVDNRGGQRALDARPRQAAGPLDGPEARTRHADQPPHQNPRTSGDDEGNSNRGPPEAPPVRREIPMNAARAALLQGSQPDSGAPQRNPQAHQGRQPDGRNRPLPHQRPENSSQDGQRQSNVNDRRMNGPSHTQMNTDIPRRDFLRREAAPERRDGGRNEAYGRNEPQSARRADSMPGPDSRSTEPAPRRDQQQPSTEPPLHHRASAPSRGSNNRGGPDRPPPGSQPPSRPVHRPHQQSTPRPDHRRPESPNGQQDPAVFRRPAPPPPPPSRAQTMDEKFRGYQNPQNVSMRGHRAEPYPRGGDRPRNMGRGQGQYRQGRFD